MDAELELGGPRFGGLEMYTQKMYITSYEI